MVIRSVVFRSADNKGLSLLGGNGQRRGSNDIIIKPITSQIEAKISSVHGRF